MENEIATKAVERWADSEVEAFLSIYSEDCIQGARRNTEVYQVISLRLAQMGIYHTPKQCREKIKKLKQDYKKAKETILQSGGSRGRTSKWFNSLDLILGNRPAHSEAVTFDATAWNATTDNVAVTNNLELDSSSAEASETPEQTQASVKVGDKWTHIEVQSLLSIYAEEEIQREFGMLRRNEKVYQKIAERLAEMGFHHTSKHCRDKIKKMKQDYRRIKELESTGVDPCKRLGRPRWFDALDAILSRKADYVHMSGTNHGETLLLEVMSDDDSRSNSNNGQESSAEDDHKERIHLDGLIDSLGTSGCHDSVSPSFGLISPSHVPGQVKSKHSERARMEEQDLYSPGTSVCCESASPSFGLRSPSQGPHHINGKRKRDSELQDVVREMEKRDAIFLETMQEMEEAHIDILRQELDQRERHYQMLIAHDAREAEAREREFTLRREEAAESRRQQEAFQQGFLNVLNRLVQVLDKTDSPVTPPLD
ncbi:hypothetical protein AALO_G00044760 [Alosa alosa]|uniref:Myb/SANT-like DNA-binding domain-containing protein n=1 Tax=Alosa alosa TaxID=278164 RepID=A0AAV6H930_9TELE|nr:zinc finger and SCAN domain-containing protein 29-like [Alosa alosa]KAG5283680.1 hypothetical protein AALO_G00044760 [Alosa alosa]